VAMCRDSVFQILKYVCGSSCTMTWIKNTDFPGGPWRTLGPDAISAQFDLFPDEIATEFTIIRRPAMRSGVLIRGLRTLKRGMCGRATAELLRVRMTSLHEQMLHLK